MPKDKTFLTEPFLSFFGSCMFEQRSLEELSEVPDIQETQIDTMEKSSESSQVLIRENPKESCFKRDEIIKMIQQIYGYADNCWSLFFLKPAEIDSCVQDILAENNSITFSELCRTIFINSKQGGPVAEMIKTKPREFAQIFHAKITGVQSLLEVSQQKFFNRLSDPYAMALLTSIQQQCATLKVTFEEDKVIANFLKTASRCGSKSKRDLLIKNWPMLFTVLGDTLFVKLTKVIKMYATNSPLELTLRLPIIIQKIKNISNSEDCRQQCTQYLDNEIKNIKLKHNTNDDLVDKSLDSYDKFCSSYMVMF